MRTKAKDRRIWIVPALLLSTALVLAVAACSDDDGSGTQADGAVQQGDKGTTPTPDKGTTPTPDKGITPTPDKGTTPTPDKGTPPPLPNCIPGMAQKDACGGSLVGTWKYKKGCIDPKGFDALKSACPTAQISNVAYAMDAGLHTLAFKADKTFIRAVKGKATGKVVIPKLCNILGCVATVAAAKLIVPAAILQCTTNSAGGCDCNVSMPVATLDQGTYTTSGGKATVTVAGKTYDYHYCVKSGALLYRGQDTNKIDNIVSYVLAK